MCRRNSAPARPEPDAPFRRGPRQFSTSLVPAILALLALAPAGAGAAEISEEIERDFALRTIGELQVTNLRGGIVIEGWAQDKIRVKAHRHVQADTVAEAHRLAAASDFRYRSLEKGRIELTAEYGRGLKLDERLRERNHPRSRMDIHVLAPAGLSLKVWAVNGEVTVRNWNAPVEARTASGPVTLETVRAPATLVLCDSCGVRVKSLRGALHLNGGSGDISLDNVEGTSIYAESTTGGLLASSVSGEQLYVSHSGAINGSRLSGRVEFHTRQGAVTLKQIDGFVSGKTETGNVTADIRRWKFLDNALVESRGGSIRFALPHAFSGDIDLSSREGHVRSDFPITESAPRQISQNPTQNEHSAARIAPRERRLVGRISEGGETLRISSDTGDVSLTSVD